MISIYFLHQKLLEDLYSKEDDLKKAEDLTDQLAQQPGVDVKPLKEKTSKVKDNHQGAKEKTKEKKEKLTQYIIYIEEYYEIIEEITEYVYITKTKPALNDPLASDPKHLKEQLADIEVTEGSFLCL